MTEGSIWVWSWDLLCPPLPQPGNNNNHNHHNHDNYSLDHSHKEKLVPWPMKSKWGKYSQTIFVAGRERNGLSEPLTQRGLGGVGGYRQTAANMKWSDPIIIIITTIIIIMIIKIMIIAAQQVCWQHQTLVWKWGVRSVRPNALCVFLVTTRLPSCSCKSSQEHQIKWVSFLFKYFNFW